MLTRYRALVLAVAVVLTAGAAREAAARDAAPGGAPTEQLRSRVERVVAVLEDPQLKAKPAARRAALRTAASEIFDFTEITRRSLGRHWQTASQTERDDLVALMTALLERSYLGRIEQYSGERIVFAGETPSPIWPRCGRVWSARGASRPRSTIASTAPATAGSSTT